MDSKCVVCGVVSGHHVVDVRAQAKLEIALKTNLNEPTGVGRRREGVLETAAVAQRARATQDLLRLRPHEQKGRARAGLKQRVKQQRGAQLVLVGALAERSGAQEQQRSPRRRRRQLR